MEILQAGAFRIIGILKTGNTVFDETMVLVKRSDLNRLLGKEETAP